MGLTTPTPHTKQPPFQKPNPPHNSQPRGRSQNSSNKGTPSPSQQPNAHQSRSASKPKPQRLKWWRKLSAAILLALTSAIGVQFVASFKFVLQENNIASPHSTSAAEKSSPAAPSQASGVQDRVSVEDVWIEQRQFDEAFSQWLKTVETIPPLQQKDLEHLALCGLYLDTHTLLIDLPDWFRQRDYLLESSEQKRLQHFRQNWQRLQNRYAALIRTSSK